MIRIRQIKIPLTEEDKLSKKCSKLLHLRETDLKKINIVSKSLDARHKPNLYFVYTVDVMVDKEKEVLAKVKNDDIFLAPSMEYVFPPSGDKVLMKRPIIVGMGPAGLFCGYLLALNGYKPILIERGECVEERTKSVSTFWETGALKPNSNVQFGEGGAGTFSDGKLVSNVKDSANRKHFIFNTFVKFGADEKILYENKPHLGTDKLCLIVSKMREAIIDMGGDVLFNTTLTDIIVKDNAIRAIEINHHETIETDILVLALGHSARDTLRMLELRHLPMEAKAFAVGIRLQHSQKLIDQNQYGRSDLPLDPASYKLTYKASNGRGVYSFCMCPGGYVINASSEDRKLAINGMSYSKRDSGNANSAIIVTVNPRDYGNEPLAGITFQEELEQKAYQMGMGKIPTQLFKDYLNDLPSQKLGTINPKFKGHYHLTNLNELFPSFINDSLKEAILHFDSQIKGFANDDTILSAVESRTSSPVRMIRNEKGESSIMGIYPCGEGAGYAGGITSAAIDGMKTAEFIAQLYHLGRVNK